MIGKADRTEIACNRGAIGVCGWQRIEHCTELSGGGHEVRWSTGGTVAVAQADGQVRPLSP